MKEFGAKFQPINSLEEMKEFISRHTSYAPLAEYSSLRDLGLRKQAFVILELFIQNLSRDSFEVRRAFVEFMACHSARLPGFRDKYSPHILGKQIIYPTLQEWQQRDPNNLEVFKMLHVTYGYYSGIPQLARLEKALSVLPNDQEVLVRLLRLQMNALEYSTHHLNEGKYLGDPNKDLKDAEGICQRCQLIADEGEKKKNLERLTYYNVLIRDWLDYLQTDQSLTFIEFCNSRGRSYCFDNHIYFKKSNI